MSDKIHPYSALPNSSFWRRSISGADFAEIDPVVSNSLHIAREDKIVTAGDCFAQHLAGRLKASGFNYFVTETGHSAIPPEDLLDYHYGTFSARYGNIYTTTLLSQLFERVYGNFVPMDQFWEGENGTIIDPFRPRIQPNGFSCLDELLADREYHFQAVRRAFEQADVFIYTLGMTESWVNTRDGAVYPLCPGVAGGVFDSREHRFVNLDFAAASAALNLFIERLTAVNSNVRIILTVSPVPLIASAETGKHVLVANTYSKAVQRIVADEAARRFSNVFYFPSYEIIAAHANYGGYYDADKREVNSAGINHVMRVFFKHYCGLDEYPAAGSAGGKSSDACKGIASAQFLSEMEAAMHIECDELALEESSDDSREHATGSCFPAAEEQNRLAGWNKFLRRFRSGGA